MELGQRLPPHSPKATGKKKNKKMWASWKIHYESWIGYDRLVYRLSNDELTMVRLLQLEVKAGFKPGCKQVSSWRHTRRSHEKGRRQNLDRRTGSDHSQRHYPLPFVYSVSYRGWSDPVCSRCCWRPMKRACWQPLERTTVKAKNLS